MLMLILLTILYVPTLVVMMQQHVISVKLQLVIFLLLDWIVMETVCQDLLTQW
jgi:hypothetical protein